MIPGTPYNCSIVWLRRDLRLSDNTALHHAARHSARICVAFVLDPMLLRSERVGAPIVQFFFSALQALREDLRRMGSDLVLLEGAFAGELMALARNVKAQALFFNEDYEPVAIERDRSVQHAFEQSGIAVHHFVDHVYAGASKVLSDSGEPYRIFTPYKRKWLQHQHLSGKAPFPSERLHAGQLLLASELPPSQTVPKPETYSHRSSTDFPCGSEAARMALTSFLRKGGAGRRYAVDRNFPGRNGTSHLSPHLRAGTIGIRTCIAAAVRAAGGGEERANIEVWVSELIWRDFYQQILKNYPHVSSKPFRTVAEGLQLRNCDAEFAAWCTARTGYPIVDAAMTQLNRYGWMHNRLRMVVASFLSKHLLQDYRKGERYFEQHLCDADTAANNGGWQWASSTGTDAAPYFRVFNPSLQSRHFDPQGAFIKSMLPELRHVPDDFIHEPWRLPPLLAAEARCEIGKDYPHPIVDHEMARKRAVEAYARVMRTS